MSTQQFTAVFQIMDHTGAWNLGESDVDNDDPNETILDIALPRDKTRWNELDRLMKQLGYYAGYDHQEINYMRRSQHQPPVRVITYPSVAAWEAGDCGILTIRRFHKDKQNAE